MLVKMCSVVVDRLIDWTVCVHDYIVERESVDSGVVSNVEPPSA